MRFDGGMPDDLACDLGIIVGSPLERNQGEQLDRSQCSLLSVGADTWPVRVLQLHAISVLVVLGHAFVQILDDLVCGWSLGQRLNSEFPRVSLASAHEVITHHSHPSQFLREIFDFKRIEWPTRKKQKNQPKETKRC